VAFLARLCVEQAVPARTLTEVAVKERKLMRGVPRGAA
jgi:hypothetical protein